MGFQCHVDLCACCFPRASARCFFDLFILLANPNPAPAIVTAEYLLLGGMSLGATPAQIVVERAMYTSPSGVTGRHERARHTAALAGAGPARCLPRVMDPLG